MGQVFDIITNVCLRTSYASLGLAERMAKKSAARTTPKQRAAKIGTNAPTATSISAESDDKLTQYLASASGPAR
jgi:hypothetical protein